jgi:hypothetical protein
MMQAQFIYTGASTISQLKVEFGGVEINTVASIAAYTTGTQTTVNLSQTGFFASDGVTAVTLVATGTYSTGALTVSGLIAVLAV